MRAATRDFFQVHGPSVQGSGPTPSPNPIEGGLSFAWAESSVSEAEVYVRDTDTGALTPVNPPQYIPVSGNQAYMSPVISQDVPKFVINASVFVSGIPYASVSESGVLTAQALISNGDACIAGYGPGVNKLYMCAGTKVNCYRYGTNTLVLNAFITGLAASVARVFDDGTYLYVLLSNGQCPVYTYNAAGTTFTLVSTQGIPNGAGAQGPPMDDPAHKVGYVGVNSVQTMFLYGGGNITAVDTLPSNTSQMVPCLTPDGLFMYWDPNGGNIQCTPVDPGVGFGSQFDTGIPSGNSLGQGTCTAGSGPYAFSVTSGGIISSFAISAFNTISPISSATVAGLGTQPLACLY